MTGLLALLLHRSDTCRACPRPRPLARDIIEGKAQDIALRCDTCRQTIEVLKSIVAGREN